MRELFKKGTKRVKSPSRGWQGVQATNRDSYVCRGLVNRLAVSTAMAYDTVVSFIVMQQIVLSAQVVQLAPLCDSICRHGSLFLV